jgi:hypothetical protein
MHGFIDYIIYIDLYDPICSFCMKLMSSKRTSIDLSTDRQLFHLRVSQLPHLRVRQLFNLRVSQEPHLRVSQHPTCESANCPNLRVSQQPHLRVN